MNTEHSLTQQLLDIDSTKTEIRKLEEQWGEAYRQRNIALLDSILADDYILTDPLGGISDKATNLAAIAENEVYFESTESLDQRIYIHIGTAVVTARSRFRGSYKGLQISGCYQYTDVFIKRDGQWQAVVSQITSIGFGLWRLRLGKFLVQVSKVIDEIRIGKRDKRRHAINPTIPLNH
jgi:hypothetical protein